MKRVHALIVTAAASAALTGAAMMLGYHRSAPAPVAEALPSRADETAPAPPGIHGQVIDETGRPVRGAVVMASEPGRPLDPARDGVVTDDRGQFAISRLPPGRYVLVAIHGHHSPGRSGPVVVVSGELELPVVVVLGLETILI